MYAVLSPAKKLVSPPPPNDTTEPLFKDHTDVLVQVMKAKSHTDLQELMGISENLSILNAERYSEFGAQLTPSVFTFAGDTYQGLDASSLSAKAIDFAQSHLGILSGLYGLLRPMDGISPYRLEMGTRLSTSRGANLYEFWGDRVTKALQSQLDATGSRVLVNLASKEYFSVVQRNALTGTVVTPVFKDVRKGVPKVISFLAKRARGMMARYIVENQLKKPESLTLFDSAGYRYQAEASTSTAPVFIREESPQTI